MAEVGWSGLDRWVASNDNSTISEQTVRLTKKGKCSAFGEAVVGSGRAEWDLTIEFESFGGISIGIYRQELRDRDNINALPTEDTFTYTPNGYGYANKTGAFTFNRERKKYGQRYRHGDKITVRLDLQARELRFLVNDEDQGLAYDGVPKGAYRLACCMQFKEQKVSITRFWTSLGKDATIPKIESTKTQTAAQDKIGKEHEVEEEPQAKVLSPETTAKQQQAAQLYAEYKEPEIDPDAPMFGDDYNDGAAAAAGADVDYGSDDGSNHAYSDDDNDDAALQNMCDEEEEEESVVVAAAEPLDAVSLIGGRSRGMSKAESKAPEPLSIESVDEDASDYFSLSGSNLKTDRNAVTCTRGTGKEGHSAFGTQLVSRGRIEWMLRIETGHSIRIGVCGSLANATDRVFTETKYGYGYGDDGNIYFGGSHIEYHNGFKAGDIIGVYLNMDMNTLKFSVNGEAHGNAFDSIKLNEKDEIRGYRLAVSLQHRPHKVVLLESTLYNVERRSPRPEANRFDKNQSNGSQHKRKLSYSTMNNVTKPKKKVTEKEDKTKPNKEKKKKGKTKEKKTKQTSSKKKVKKVKTPAKASKKKGKDKDTTASKRKGKDKDAKGKKKAKDKDPKGKKKSKKREEEKKEDSGGKKSKFKWNKRENQSKDKWDGAGGKLVIEKSSVSTKTNIKDGNSCFGKLKVKGNNMKCKWDVTIKQGDNIGVGVCNISGTLKTAKNKKLLTQSFTNDICGYGYMGNDGGIQRSGRYKKYGQKFKAGDKVSIILDMKQKTLAFELNGDNQGTAFKNLPAGEYRVAATFFEKSQKITLNKTTVWDIVK
eukprot:249347_1